MQISNFTSQNVGIYSRLLFNLMNKIKHLNEGHRGLLENISTEAAYEAQRTSSTGQGESHLKQS